MKEIALFFMIAFMTLCVNTYSQPYSNYLDDTCEWYYYQEGVDGGSITRSYITYYIDGDTFTNNNYYFKRYYNRIDTIYSGMFGTTNVNYETRILSDLIREDSLKRLYMLYSANTDYLLYDFNLSLNDTFTNASCTVFDIDTITLNNTTLNWFLQEYSPNGKTGLIEGIGYNRILCGTPFHAYQSLVCFKKQSETLSVDSTKDCNSFLQPNGLLTSFKDLFVPTEIIIYPNPTEDILRFRVSDINMISSVSILDLNGKLIYVEKEIISEKSINVSKLQSSAYFIRFSFLNGQTITKKFIKN